jgi:hypothetical protein
VQVTASNVFKTLAAATDNPIDFQFMVAAFVRLLQNPLIVAQAVYIQVI